MKMSKKEVKRILRILEKKKIENKDESELKGVVH